MLVKQYIRAILSLQPKAFIMENVSMLKSDTHRFYMEHSDALVPTFRELLLQHEKDLPRA